MQIFSDGAAPASVHPEKHRAEVFYGWSEASDGNGKDPNVQAAILRALELKDSQLVQAQQVHGKNVVVIQKDSANLWPQTDGFISALPSRVLAVFAADCMPIGLWDHTRIAIVHAGWRGIVGGIIEEALNQFPNKNEVQAFLGPHIQNCCYQVTEEILPHFSSSAVIHAEEKIYLSLTIAAKERLFRAGMGDSQIKRIGPCTACSKNLYSFRRDKTEKRLLSFIYKK